MATSAEPSLDWWRGGAIGRRTGGAAPRVLFGQVHEDAAVELAALERLGKRANVLCIASGGDTAFALLGGNVERVQAVDINPAQVALVSLKQAAIQELGPAELLVCLDHDARPCYPALRQRLEPTTRAFWDANVEDLRYGLNHCGWAEARLRLARRIFQVFVHRRAVLLRLLELDDVPAQHAWYQRHWRNLPWRLLVAVAFSRPALGLLYRRGVVRGVPSDFGGLMERRVEHALTASSNRDNPYLWQALLGRYPPSASGLPLYLKKAPLPFERLQLATAEVATWLDQQPAGALDFVALSNVTELTSASFGAQLARAAARAMRPGALVLVRSIFPPPAAHPFASALQAEPELSSQLEQLDRSLVCNFIRVFSRAEA